MDTHSKGYVEKLFERDIVSRTDIDAMEQAIRDARSTVSSSSSTLKRCGILETSAYMSMRIKLLRWISDYAHGGKKGDGTNEGVAEAVRFHIGEGISVRGEYGGSSSTPPRVQLSWRHSDNDGTLPMVVPTSSNQPCKRQPIDEENDENDEVEQPPQKKITKRKKGAI